VTDTRGRLNIDAGPGQWNLSGSIDETSALVELLARAQGGLLVLDLAGVTFINSLGVRDWIRMQSEASRQHIAIELRRVSEPIIHQLNMIIATRGSSRVASFYAPYACDACGREESLLIDVAANAVGLANLVAPAMPCPECGAQMAFNDFPERYFSFLVPETPRPG
jgi:eukaryotic-like serine/threonine-protein kinase